MERLYSKILFILCILFFVFDLQAQNLDSLSVIDSKYDSILKSDEAAMNILFYKHKNDVLINNLGPFGSPFYYPTAFYISRKKQLIIKFDSLNIKLYNLSGFKPFTNIIYINASRKEQQFSIKHIQKFGKLLFFDFDFKKISSPGAYVNQEAKITSFTGALKYQSKKDNYEIKFASRISRNFYEENGGLFDVENYEKSLFNDERTYSVNLRNSNSFLKKYVYQLNQRVDLFQLNSDSTNKKKIYLKYQLSYSAQQRVFFDNDPLSNIYNEIYIDSIATIDSIYSNNISSTGFVGFKKNQFSFELFGQYNQQKYLQSFGMSSLYHDIYIGLVSFIKRKSLIVNVVGKYGIDGYRGRDIDSELALSYDKKKFIIKGGVSYFLNEPDLKFVNYTSNHFIWNNSSFEKQSILDFSLNFKLKKNQLEFSIESKFLNKTLYYDSLAIANQDENTQSISMFSLAKDYELWNFHFRTAFVYQLTSDKTLFPLPKMIGRQVLFYQKHIFSGALKFQFGVGFSYSTDYYGYAYMPAINEFYVQENTKLGYYPRIDIFINTHLKRAQIFLKYEHFNAGRSLHKSYVTPGYPPLSKSLKFGVSWNMFD